ncbi:MAG: hypothetical protein O3B84_02625 [Chloroflexi bacterium]|nr:hypothetical protein [Chloroflexota bacterium]
MAADLLSEHRAFVDFLRQAQGVLGRALEPTQRLRGLFAPFQQLLMEDFLGPAMREISSPDPYLQHLLYRSADRTFAVVAFVLRPKASTPIIDHGTWGIAGLYQGAVSQRVYRRLDDGNSQRTILSRPKKRRLKAGDISLILPGDGDIQQVETTSKVPSVSVMAMGADIGCLGRNTYDARSGEVTGFRLGYSNANCLPG